MNFALFRRDAIQRYLCTPLKWLCFGLSCYGAALRAEKAVPTADDITDISLENLLNMEVYSASKFLQKKADAPSAVTVITSADIKDYGYRTLSDILKSIRGLYVGYDRNYSYVGTRGFGIPGDYNTRILLLLDGYRVNDNLYDAFSPDTSFLLDVNLIERVEYVPGAGSSIYGNNAFFGVINVITKSGKDLKGHGVEMSGRFASYNTDQERLTYGKRFDNGADVLVSGTHWDSGGQTLFYPEFNSPATNNGITRHTDYDKGDRLFGKFSYQNFTFEAALSNRIKGVPTASWGTVFNDSKNRTQDQQAFLDLKYYDDLLDNLQVNAHAYYSYYDYNGTSPYDYPPLTINHDASRGGWWGGEFKLLSTQFDRHKLVTGVEYQDNYLQNQSNYDIAPHFSYLNTKHDSYRYGLYAQDEFALLDDLILNAGLRYDYFSTFGDTVNPRLALIYKPRDDLTLKMLYGTAFRAPNQYELYYAPASAGYKTSTGLQPETIESYEGIIEYQPTHDWRMLASAFHYQIDNLIQLVMDTDQLLTFKNRSSNEALGTEFEIEHLWDNGTRLRASYAWVNATNEANHILVNSPISLATLNLSLPIYDNWFRAGIDGQYTSSRKLLAGAGSTRGYPLVNLTLTTGDKLTKGLLKGLEISGSVYNLLDQGYATVGGEEHVMREIPMDGRNFRVVFTYRF